MLLTAVAHSILVAVAVAMACMLAALVWVMLSNKATAFDSLGGFQQQVGGGVPLYLRFFKNT